MERNNEEEKMTVDTNSPVCSRLAMEICVLDSNQIMNRKISFFTKMHKGGKRKKLNTNNKNQTNKASFYLCRGSLKSCHALR